MNNAVIMINESKKESVEVKQYGSKNVLYIDAPNVEDAARLLVENKDRAADTVATAPIVTETKEEEPHFKMIKLDIVNGEAKHFRRTKEGKAFIKRVAEAEKEEGFTLSANELIYLECLVLQGKTLEAFEAAYKIGRYDGIHTNK